MDTLRIATLNINGLSSPARQDMLNAFVRLHDIDILLLQEVTHPFNTGFQGYTIHYNIGTSRRGTAILTRDTIVVTNLSRLPSGRAIAATLGTLLIINIYAPSGTSKRAERESFYNNDLPLLLESASDDILLGGDFNCVLDAADSTGRGSFSRSLAALVQGYALRDAWQARPDSHAYTHHTIHVATRIDRFYMSRDLMTRKTGIATVAAAFTDHLAVVLRLSWSTLLPRRGRGTWKLNSDILTSDHVMEALQQHWIRWKQQQHRYANINLWWVRHCKKRLRQMFQSMEAESRRDLRRLEDFYYECIYDIIRAADRNPDTIASLHHFKAKLIRLHTKRFRMSMMDTADADILPGESPTLYQLIRRHKRQVTRIVRSVKDEHGVIQTSPAGVASAFVAFFQEKFRHVNVDPESVNVFANLVRAEQSSSPIPDYESPFTLEEIQQAVDAGGKNRAPGRDGLGLEFYRAARTIMGDDLRRILNTMFFDRAITPQQKLGTIVCLPKHGPMLTPADRRPITLLNTDCKLLTRILARRLRPLIDLHLHSTQYCGVTGNTILDAVATVRDIASYAENVHLPLCILTLDFQHAFDSIAHEYMFTILRSYGLSHHFVTLLQHLYTDTISYIQINGHLHGPIPIRRGVRQGCPLSMALYTLCLQPFLTMLKQRLPGVRIGPDSEPVSVVAYADDVTIFLTSADDISTVQEAIQQFERASGARLNPRKSRALPIGRWPAVDNILGIPCLHHVRILGIHLWRTLRQTISASWVQLVGLVKTQAKDCYLRDLCLTHRILYVHVYLLARLWYLAQVLPAPRLCIQQITTAVTYFIWRGATFRVPISTLQSRRTDGGLELLDIAAKCRALLLSRMHVQGARPGSVMAACLRNWGLNERPSNPPNAATYPTQMVHIRAYAIDMPYVPTPRPEDTPKLWRRRIYRVLHTMAVAAAPVRPIRIVTLHPNHDWTRIWRNLTLAWIPDVIRSTWYMAIHDILPTKERLNRIALSANDRCTYCGQTDTLSHRIMECGAGRDMWRWTRVRMAVILRSNAYHISNDWPLRPQFKFAPRQRHGAVLWMLAYFVYFRLQHADQPTLLDYADFMRRARWKAYSLPQRLQRIGNYLAVL